MYICTFVNGAALCSGLVLWVCNLMHSMGGKWTHYTFEINEHMGCLRLVGSLKL